MVATAAFEPFNSAIRLRPAAHPLGAFDDRRRPPAAAPRRTGRGRRALRERGHRRPPLRPLRPRPRRRAGHGARAAPRAAISSQRSHRLPASFLSSRATVGLSSPRRAALCRVMSRLSGARRVSRAQDYRLLDLILCRSLSPCERDRNAAVHTTATTQQCPPRAWVFVMGCSFSSCCFRGARLARALLVGERGDRAAHAGRQAPGVI